MVQKLSPISLTTRAAVGKNHSIPITKYPSCRNAPLKAASACRRQSPFFNLLLVGNHLICQKTTQFTLMRLTNLSIVFYSFRKNTIFSTIGSCSLSMVICMGTGQSKRKLHPNEQNLPKFQAGNMRYRQVMLCAFFTLCNFLSRHSNFSIEKCHFYHFDS